MSRGRGDRAAIETGVRLVEEGEAVAIFPGGTVRNDGPWFRGAAKIALRAGVPVLPVRLFDSDRALAGRRVRFPRLHVADRRADRGGAREADDRVGARADRAVREASRRSSGAEHAGTGGTSGARPRPTRRRHTRP